MSAAEIILIVIGVAIFLLGYLMPARKKDLDEEVRLISEDEVRKMVAGEMEHVKEKISDIVDETVNYSIEKTERAMERMTNEKVMAVSEYSDTVLEEINKNHKEVVFLYDMLNDKHDNLMSTINEATMAADSVKETTKDSEIMAHEAAEKLEAVLQASDEAADSIKDAQNAAAKVQKAAQDSMRIVIRAVEGVKKELAALRAAKAEYAAEIREEQPAADMSRMKEQTLTEAEKPQEMAEQSRPQRANPEAETDNQRESMEREGTGHIGELSGTEQVRPQKVKPEAETGYQQESMNEADSGHIGELSGTEQSRPRNMEPEERMGYLRGREPEAETELSRPQMAESEVRAAYPQGMPEAGYVQDNMDGDGFDRTENMLEAGQNRLQGQQAEYPQQMPVNHGRFGRPALGSTTDLQEETGAEEEQVDFTPISPRRVEIIHQPDGDYVAEDIDDMSTSEAFASMGIFAPKEETKRKSRTRKAPRRERPQDAAPAVDLQFAQGKDNGRNSNERILELHKAGKSNMAIARELGLGLGEVKLVIDLFEGM